MGFYSENTIEQKRVTKLTGDINISDAFKAECNERGIPIWDAYNIQKRLRFEVEEEQIKGSEKVDERLMELLNEKSKKEVSHDYIERYNIANSQKKNMIPPKGDSTLPPKEQIKIPPRARDAKSFNSEDKELLNKIMLQNQKIINQNKIIIEEIKKLRR
ncbi:hypothetical protein [Methanobrevibacter oralis]|uniref:Uncharacterized protein n=1 Tax=Methanobrevibacter oralis TaxID=66851 RepID=A0A166C728_METOA|nr:hypothetical protein [Methanobrevibacter oralis]KZX11827.1 hypothetical protein MBORA_13670 [Methanobrevibacter oralis]